MKPATLLSIVFCLACFLATAPAAVAQSYIPDSSFWETKASMNQARSYFPAVNWGRKIYVFGGAIADNGVYTNSIEEYNIVSDEWVEKAPLPQPMCAMAAVELNGAIYIIGGMTDQTGATSIQKVYRYFPGVGTFDADTIAPLPATRSFLSACAAGGKIYAIGGATGFFGAVSNKVYVYDPSDNTWSVGKDLNIGRAAHTCAVVGSKIYVMGGTIGWFSSINSVEVFDTQNPELGWELSDKPLVHARAGHGSAALSNIIYALGGIESTSSAEMSVESYGPEIEDGDNWEVFKTLTYDRRAFGCVALPSDDFGSWPPYIYIMGGNSGNSVLSTTQRLGIITVVGANEVLPASTGNTIAALSNFPNPFDQNTTISYTVGKSAHVVMAIFDARGQLISTPVSGLQAPGEHHVSFDAARLETGVYFCVLNSNDGAGLIRKMVVMR